MSRVDTSMEDLPVEVMVDILSRLPVKMIIYCKCVCKKWLNIVLDSYFADLHLSRSPSGLMIYHNSVKENRSFPNPGILKWVEVIDELDYHHVYHDPVMKLDLNMSPIFQHSRVLPVGSVNGLICLSQCVLKNNNYFICNPITREYMILPTQHYYKERYAVINHGFGVSSLTKAYKVIRVIRGICMRPTSNSEAEVYTLGTGQWRSLGHVPYRLHRSYGRFLNGNTHWYVSRKDSLENICAFDYDNETFKLFPSPPVETIQGSRFLLRTLGVLKGCLCQCDCYDSHLTVWVMKEYGIKKSWHKELVIERSMNVNMDFRMMYIMYIIEGLKDGTILMESFRDKLLAYCPRRKTIVDTDLFDCRLIGLAYRPSFNRLHNFRNERVLLF